MPGMHKALGSSPPNLIQDQFPKPGLLIIVFYYHRPDAELRQKALSIDRCCKLGSYR